MHTTVTEARWDRTFRAPCDLPGCPGDATWLAVIEHAVRADDTPVVLSRAVVLRCDAEPEDA